jgi:hypothetical protein
MIHKATGYLESQMKNGWWLDFDTLAGSSDEWVTAYVAEVLAMSKCQQATELSTIAFNKLMKRRRWNSGWGYNIWVPRDADTTIFVIALAEKIEKTHHKRIQSAIKFLKKHIDEQGGIRTYLNLRKIRKFTGLSKNISFKGWHQAHSCVTANAMRLKSLASHYDQLSAFIEPNLEENDFLEGYWWPHPAYPSALAVEGLALHASKTNSMKNIKKWALKNLSKNVSNSIFINACLLQIVLTGTEETLISDDTISLILQFNNLQKLDGSWHGTANLRIPPTYCTDPKKIRQWSYTHKGGGSIRNDQHGIYTTATVLKTLFLVQHYYENDKSNKRQKSDALFFN